MQSGEPEEREGTGDPSINTSGITEVEARQILQEIESIIYSWSPSIPYTDPRVQTLDNSRIEELFGKPLSRVTSQQIHYQDAARYEVNRRTRRGGRYKKSLAPPSSDRTASTSSPHEPTADSGSEQTESRDKE